MRAYFPLAVVVFTSLVFFAVIFLPVRKVRGEQGNAPIYSIKCPMGTVFLGTLALGVYGSLARLSVYEGYIVAKLFRAQKIPISGMKIVDKSHWWGGYMRITNGDRKIQVSPGFQRKKLRAALARAGYQFDD